MAAHSSDAVPGRQTVFAVYGGRNLFLMLNYKFTFYCMTRNLHTYYYNAVLDAYFLFNNFIYKHKCVKFVCL